MSPIRVLIVEDSPVVGEHLRRIISADRRFEVAALATSGEEALEVVECVAPDVISMDIQLPGIQGFETTRRIMASRPTPIVVVSGLESKEMGLTMQALRAGALAVVEKPVSATHQDYVLLAGKLCTQLAIMSEVKVVRQRPVHEQHASQLKISQLSPFSPYKVLGVAASTGGPNALLQLLSALGSDFPLPVVVVQHMTPAFLQGFADWLASVTPFSVSVLRQTMTMQSSHVYLSPGNHAHVAVDGMTVSPDYGAPIGGHRPSANALFSSMARTLLSSAIGVVLTGMGDDGAAGIRELKLAGSFTIAEDESTAVVYGMPGSAVRLGAIREILPLGDIAPRLLNLANMRAETK
jgi:two-component system, chemotaxis family, protein-glutamate methylesterase/glutaminase